jgi:hypothetical protein
LSPGYQCTPAVRRARRRPSDVARRHASPIGLTSHAAAPLPERLLEPAGQSRSCKCCRRRSRVSPLRARWAQCPIAPSRMFALPGARNRAARGGESGPDRRRGLSSEGRRPTRGAAPPLDGFGRAARRSKVAKIVVATRRLHAKVSVEREKTPPCRAFSMRRRGLEPPPGYPGPGPQPGNPRVRSVQGVRSARSTTAARTIWTHRTGRKSPRMLPRALHTDEPGWVRGDPGRMKSGVGDDPLGDGGEQVVLACEVVGDQPFAGQRGLLADGVRRWWLDSRARPGGRPRPGRSALCGPRSPAGE